MKPVLLPHRAFALLEFEGYIRTLEQRLEQYYYSNAWLVAPKTYWVKTPTDALILGLVQVIITSLAMRYAMDDQKLEFQREAKFTLVTSAGCYEEPYYPLGMNLLTYHSDLLPCYRKPSEIAPISALDRLLYLYAEIPTALTHGAADVGPETLIKLVIRETFSSMQVGNSNPSILHPAVTVCIAGQVRDSSGINEEYNLEENQRIWFPVVPADKTMSGVMDVILGFEEE